MWSTLSIYWSNHLSGILDGQMSTIIIYFLVTLANSLSIWMLFFLLKWWSIIMYIDFLEFLIVKPYLSNIFDVKLFCIIFIFKLCVLYEIRIHIYSNIFTLNQSTIISYSTTIIKDFFVNFWIKFYFYNICKKSTAYKLALYSPKY
mgnify:CR=1 FL=1